MTLTGLLAGRDRGTVTAVTRAPLCCFLALGLTCSSVVQGQETSAPGAPAEATGPALYDQGKYVEAARAFEKEGTHKGLYNAGMARHAAFHEALATDRWRRYLARPEVAEQDRADLERRIAGARANLVTVRFTADAAPVARSLVLEREGQADDAWTVQWPAGQTDVEVALDAVDWQVRLGGGAEAAKLAQVVVRKGEAVVVSFVTEVVPSPVVLRLGPPRALRRGVTVTWTGPSAAPPEQEVRAAEARWDLTPGIWGVRVQAEGYDSAEKRLELRGVPASVEFALRPNRIERARLGLGIGLGVASMALVVTGGVVASGGEWGRFSSACGDNDSCAGRLQGHRRTANGLVILGAGLGGLVPAITAGRGPAQRALGIEAGVGGGLLVASLAWYIGENVGLPTSFPRERVAASLLGVGSGMLTSAIVGIITHRIARQSPRKTATKGGNP